MLTSSRGRVGWDVSVPEFAVLSFGCGFCAFSLVFVGVCDADPVTVALATSYLV